MGSGAAAPTVGDGARAGSLLLDRLHRLRALEHQRVPLELILILEQLPRTTLDVQTRYRALRTLEEAVLQVAAALDERGEGVRVAVAGHGPGLSLEQRIYAAMARTCVHLLHALDHGQGFFSEQNESGRLWAVHAGFRFFSRALLGSVRAGRDWPAGAWQGLHDLFVYLVMRGSVRLHGGALALAEDDPDPELAYKRLLLIGLVAELVGRQHIDGTVVTRLRALANAARLVASDGLVGEFGLILVEVGRDGPPRLKVGSLDDPFRGWVLRVPQEFHSLLRSLDPFHQHAGAGAP